MNETRGTRNDRPAGAIRRILVALDASADSSAVLDAAADLAALLDAHLQGLFVEDLDLLELPTRAFATEIDSLSGEPRRLLPQDLERHLRRRAARARKALERVATPLHLRWSFRTVRGRVSAELLAAETDLIALGTRGHSLRRGPGSTAAEVVVRAGAPVLVLRGGARLGATVFVVADESAASERALAVAAEIARRRGTPLTVLVPGGGEERPRKVTERLREIERAGGPAVGGIEVRVEAVPGPVTRQLVEVIGKRGYGLLVVPRNAGLGDAESLRELVRRALCPLLVVG